jgi:hypothetical protein
MAIDKLQKDALSNTVTANIASVAIGANVSINSSTFVVGTGQIKATGITLPSNFGVSSNTTNLLENRNGQLFFNGRRVDLVNEYAGTNPAVYGYAAGGYTSASSSTVSTTDRITFTTSTTAASTVSNLSAVTYGCSGISDVSQYGYIVGGHTGAYTAKTDVVTFTTSVTAARTASNLSISVKGWPTGISDAAVYGYAMGGVSLSGGSSVYLTQTDRITFSTQLFAASTTGNISTGTFYASGLSDASVYGYHLGGTTGELVATAYRITFSTSTTAASTLSNLIAPRSFTGAVSDNITYGYIMGGTTRIGSTPNVTSATDRLTFSTSITAAATVSNLSSNRKVAAGSSDGVIYGYALGGDTQGNDAGIVATSDRITFASGISAASTVNNLSQVKIGAAGLSDGAV